MDIFTLKMYQKQLSIIILTWNGQEVIKQNLDSLLRNFDDKNWEIIVVDNGSTDKTRQIVFQEYPQVKLIENKENLGYAKGNNVGIRQAQGKYTLLLNQDVEQIGDAITPMIEFLERNEVYGAVAPQLLYPNGRVQDSCRPFYNWPNLFKDYLTFGFWRKKFYNHHKSQIVDQPMASALFFRSELLKKLDGFDEHRDFWLYFNDMDLSYRLHRLGFGHYFSTKAQFYHHHGQSTRKLFPCKRLTEYHRGLRRYFLKHFIENEFRPSYWVLHIVLAFSFVVAMAREMVRFALDKIKK